MVGPWEQMTESSIGVRQRGKDRGHRWQGSGRRRGDWGVQRRCGRCKRGVHGRGGGGSGQSGWRHNSGAEMFHRRGVAGMEVDGGGAENTGRDGAGG